MRNPDLLPERDGEFAIFARHLIAKAAEKRAAWNIPESAITALEAADTVFQAAWAIAGNRQSRTSAQVTDKNTARMALEQLLRPFIKVHLKYNARISEGELNEMRLKPRKRKYARSAIPATVPVVAIKRDSGSAVTLQFRQQPDADGSGRRALPKGARFAQVMGKIGEMPATPENCTDSIFTSNNQLRLTHKPEDKGKEFFFYARWLNARGQPGEWSQRYSFIIA